MNKFKAKIILIGILVFGFLASNCQAVILYLEPKEGNFSKGDVFLVNLMVNTEKEKINAAKIELVFPPEKLEVVEIIKGNSIFSFWPEEPSFSNQKGLVSFIGGVPLGFEGEGKILSVAFKVNFSENETGFAEINFSENNQVLKNDGLGTETKIQTQKSVFALFSKPAGISKNEWEEIIKQDTIPPEPFEISVNKVSLIFDGQYFIAFQTIDQQTGIDHYEIKEGKKPWKRVQSPYLLEDQNLSSRILVKAVDKAGNERISELLPLFPKKPFYRTPQFWLILIFGLLISGSIIILLSKKFKKYLKK